MSELYIKPAEMEQRTDNSDFNEYIEKEIVYPIKIAL